MHLMEESDNYNVYTQDEKEEFIFCIFKHLCLGGDICQVLSYTLCIMFDYHYYYDTMFASISIVLIGH